MCNNRSENILKMSIVETEDVVPVTTVETVVTTNPDMEEAEETVGWASCQGRLQMCHDVVHAITATTISLLCL